jgi:hypothetical protein
LFHLALRGRGLLAGIIELLLQLRLLQIRALLFLSPNHRFPLLQLGIYFFLHFERQCRLLI